MPDPPTCRFYMVTGEKGWLPYGTDCSGEDRREAYCVKGRCLEFGGDGTPLYEHGPGEQPRFRRALVTGEEVPLEGVLWKEGRSRRSLMLNSTRVAGSIDQEYLRQIVRDFNRSTASPPASTWPSTDGPLSFRSLSEGSGNDDFSVNFDNPIDIAELPDFGAEVMATEEGEVEDAVEFPVEVAVIYTTASASHVCRLGVLIATLLIWLL